MATIQWKCKTPHAQCEAQDWKHYKDLSDSEAAEFIEKKAPACHTFNYRIKPEDNSPEAKP